MEEAVEHADDIAENITKTGDKLIYYTKQFVDEGATVVVKVWKSIQQGIQQLSDAWTKW